MPKKTESEPNRVSTFCPDGNAEFSRLEDGSVYITYYHGAPGSGIETNLTLSPGHWAAAVASVSQSSDGQGEALAFHMGQP